MFDVTLLVAGQAGQGVDTSSELLARALYRVGYNVFAYPNVMSRIRGGHNYTSIRVSDQPVACCVARHNLLLALDESSSDIHATELVDGGVAILDGDEAREGDERNRVLRIPLTRIAERVGADLTMRNVVGLGAMLALVGQPLDAMFDLMQERFGAKGERVVRLNRECLRAGADYAVRKLRGGCLCAIPALSRQQTGRLLTGSQAVALGGLAADVRFYAGYPMSPATPIMEFLALQQDQFPLVVEQAEDELGALNMVLGASYAGVRAMTATSGGGFSLMVEALGLSGMTELPCVVVIAQRPGPGTGLPTRTEQGELLFAINASQDEFPRFVLAPGTAGEAFNLTQRAFDLAYHFHVPAIILIDQYLADSLWTVPSLQLHTSGSIGDFAEKDWEGRAPNTFCTYLVTDDGISPRVRPGILPQAVHCIGSEHTEEGYPTEDAKIRIAMQRKRMAKLRAMSTATGSLGGAVASGQDSDLVVVCWGSTFGVVNEAVDRLRTEHYSVGSLHLSALAPFPRAQVLARLSQARCVVTVEVNSTGQLGRLLRRETLIQPTAEVLKYDGRPFTVDELVEELRPFCA